MKKSAGVIIILNNNKILLSHATNARWEKTFSFPKGGIEKDEDVVQAAGELAFRLFDFLDGVARGESPEHLDALAHHAAAGARRALLRDDGARAAAPTADFPAPLRRSLRALGGVGLSPRV